MKPEPLKGKLQWMTELKSPCNQKVAYDFDIESAVEFLKAKMDKHRKNNNLWRLPKDESWSMVEAWIDEAFADVMEEKHFIRCFQKMRLYLKEIYELA